MIFMNVQGWGLSLLGACLFAGGIPLVRRLGQGKLLLREGVAVLVGAVLGPVLGVRYSWPAAATLLVFFALQWALAAVDADTREIPDFFSLQLLAVGVVSCWTMPGLAWWSRLGGMLCVSLPMLLLCFWKEGAFGGGDLKLMFACGLLLGLKISLLSAFFAILAGGGYGAWLLLRHRAAGADHFAFGPFLCMGMLGAVLWGDAVLEWYLCLCGF